MQIQFRDITNGGSILTTISNAMQIPGLGETVILPSVGGAWTVSVIENDFTTNPQSAIIFVQPGQSFA